MNQPAKYRNSHASLLKLEDGLASGNLDEESFEYYLFERYRRTSINWKHRLYYHVKPLLPDSLRRKMRRRYVTLQVRPRFPAWPIEPVLTNLLWNSLKNILAAKEHQAVYWISPWPSGTRVAFAITHDVEWGEGLSSAPAVAATEKELGFRSSWNIVPERYIIDWGALDRLTADGFEVGVHGLRHDGRLFMSDKHFKVLVPRVNGYLQSWRASGFRSESTLRNADWMPALQADYDTSFPDTDPFEPMPGGCCSVWPYFIDHLVELPITMPQDYTLFEVLCHQDISIWKKKADWIEQNRGLVLIDVHPDYMTSPKRHQLYQEFLVYMKSKNSVWHALPRDIAQWWRDRDASTLRRKSGKYIIEGPVCDRGSIVRTTLENGFLRHEFI